MLQPFLFIGVGGSGGKTLRVVHEELEQRLRALQWEGDFPEAWQFLHIDVPTHPDGNDPDLPAQLPATDYLGLVAPNTKYEGVDDTLVAGTRGDGGSRFLSSLVGWRPDPEKVPVDIERGAGQYRAIGRAVALANLREIGIEIGQAITDLRAPEVRQELAAITEKITDAAPGGLQPPTAVIISSLAGGAGAGVFLDVCDVVRVRGGTWGDASVGILYAPDVFADLARGKKPGVNPNALATISEVLAGYWNSERPRDGEFAALDRAELPPGAIRRRGPRFPFIVGSSNNHVAFGKQNNVYRAMGRTIAAWTLSPRVQDSFTAYLGGNWVAGAANMPDATGLRADGGEAPLNALGSSAVSVGSTRFATYSAERLAKVALDRALRAHWEGRDVPKEVKPEAALQDVVRQQQRDFIARSRLDEIGETNNQILSALRPPDRKGRLATLERQVLDNVTGGRPHASPRQWIEAIIQRLRECDRPFTDTEQLAVQESARQWVVSIQAHLIDHTATTLAEYGAPVTVKLLEGLISELEGVLADLEQERAKLDNWSGKRDEQIAGGFAGWGNDRMTADNSMIRSGVTSAIDAIDWGSEGALRVVTIALVSDLRDHLARPLLAAVRNAVDRLALEEQETVSGRPSPALGWPTGKVVPTRFEPAPNERLIDSVDRYPAELSAQLIRSVTATTEGGAYREAAIQIVRGARTPEQPQTLIRVVQPWVPEKAEYRPSGSGPAASARLEVDLGVDDILGRAVAWVNDKDPNNALGSHIRQPLKNYLAPEAADPQEHQRRLNGFRDAFASALDTAAPLVAIDAGTLNRIHGHAVPRYATMFTELPFAQGTPAHDVAWNVLAERGLVDDQNVVDAFGDGPQTRIDIFSYLAAPYHPAVFNSLMAPIAADWAAAKSNRTARTEFWRFRRSRPLPYFIPLAPSVRRDVVRGWWTAVALGQVEIDDGGAIRVFDPETGDLVAFPDPLLGPEIHEVYDRLPALLESLPLAWLSCNSGDAQALRPYARLRELGHSLRDDDEYLYLSHELNDWLANGTVPRRAPQPVAERAGTATDDWKSRRDALVTFFSHQRDYYKDEVFSRVLDIRPGDFFATPRAFELREDVKSAFDTLIERLEKFAPIKDIAG